MIIGLTGGIGAGKSTVAQYFRDCGVLIIDTDEIAQQLLEPDQPLLKEVVQYFGEKTTVAGALEYQMLRGTLATARVSAWKVRLRIISRLHPAPQVSSIS